MAQVIAGQPLRTIIMAIDTQEMPPSHRLMARDQNRQAIITIRPIILEEMADMVPQQRANMKTWQCITGAPTNPGLTLRPRARLHRLTRQEKAIITTKILPRLTLRPEVPIMLTPRAQQADRRTTIMQAATPMP